MFQDSAKTIAAQPGFILRLFGLRREQPIGAMRYILIFILWNILSYNIPLFLYSFNNLDMLTLNGILTLVNEILVITFFTAVGFYIIFMAIPFAVKPVTAIFLLLNSIALYFVVTYQVILDKSMMGNIFNTQMDEATSYFSMKLVAYVIGLGILPAIYFSTFKLKRPFRVRLTIQTFLISFLALSIIYMTSSTWLWFDKHGKYLGGLVMPWSYVINTSILKSEEASSNRTQQLLSPATIPANDKNVVVLVIGETARSQNFQLFGYEKNTNPLLTQADITAIDGTSCSTYTTASIECMLSHTSKNPGDFEPLPSYLTRHDVDVIWRSKNWGEPPIKVSSYLKVKDLAGQCSRDDCKYDGVLLSGLLEQIESSTKNNVFVVLHTKGSHGPSYYKMYPEAFEVFKPVCKFVDLDRCSSEELINAYDNSILYTDYFITSLIDELKKLKNIPASMIYASDHGESLGEYGLYLHGTPYSMAPDFQKNIPFIIWMSDTFKNKHQIEKLQSQPMTHQNIFHSVLGAFGVQSAEYDQDLDIYN